MAIDFKSPLDIEGFGATKNTIGNTPQVTSIGTNIGNLATEPTITPPKVESDMDAGDISSAVTGDSLNIATTPTTPPGTSGIVGASTDLTERIATSEVERAGITAQERQVKADQDMERLKAEQGIEGAQADVETITEGTQLQDLQRTELETNLDALGVDMGEFTSLAKGVAQLQGDLARLDAEEMAVVEQARLRGETTSFAGGQIAKEKRFFAIQRAGISAELGAKAAFLQALQGNFKLAQSMTKEIVDNAFLERQDKLDNLNEVIDNNQDILDNLNKADADALKASAKAEADQLKADKSDFDAKLKLSISESAAYKAAGLTYNDVKDMDLAEFTDLVSQHITDDVSGGAVGSTFTDSQINKGAFAAGMSIAEFKQLPVDAANEWIQSGINQEALQKDLSGNIELVTEGAEIKGKSKKETEFAIRAMITEAGLDPETYDGGKYAKGGGGVAGFFKGIKDLFSDNKVTVEESLERRDNLP